MTRTAPTRDPDDTKAAAFFTGALTLAAGGAGFLVAGLVLGFDYLLHGQPDERAQLAERRARDSRQRYEDALSWLEADRAERARARRAKRDWFNADPATRGDAPDSGETLGRVAARAWNSLIVGVGRFRNGWTAGRAEARQRRADGDPHWWKPARRERPARDAGQQPEPAAPPAPEPAPVSQPQPTTDDIVDVEIVPDTEEPKPRDVIHVDNKQADPGNDPTIGSYAQRLDQINDEVAATRNGRPADPSPPRTALQ